MDQPNIFLRWAMYHFAGGDAYLLGLMAFVVAQVALSRTSGAKGRRWLIIGGRISLIWAIADPSPIPGVCPAVVDRDRWSFTKTPTGRINRGYLRKGRRLLSTGSGRPGSRRDSV